MKNKIKYYTIEPNIKDRWVINLPDELDIPEFLINKVSDLNYSNDRGWKPIKISILDLIGFNITKKLNNNQIKLPFKVKLKKLNSFGETVESITIISERFNINYGKFNYISNDISVIKFTLYPIKICVD